MAAPNPFADDPDRNFTDSDWKQVAGAYDPGGGDSFSGDGGGETILVGTKIPFNKLQAFHRYWLGYQGCSTGGILGVTLQRTLPKRHPIFAELAADTSHTQAFKLDSRASQFSPLAGLKRFITNFAAYPTTPYYTGYRFAKGNVGFKDLDYELAADDQIDTYTKASDSYGPGYSFPSEWQRFTAFDPAPRVETLSLDGFTLRYAEGRGNTTPPNSNPFNSAGTPAPVGQLLVKADLALTTYKLPQEFLFDNQSFFPRNILAGLGKVNRYALFGQAAGTLLFFGVEMSKRRFSLRVPNNYTTFNETKYLWKVKFMFSFFDPIKGYDNDNWGLTPPVTISTNRGHNNVFWVGGRDASGGILTGDHNSMRWFFANASGNINDPGLLPSFDHAQLWRPVTNTAGSPVNPVQM